MPEVLFEGIELSGSFTSFTIVKRRIVAVFMGVVAEEAGGL